MNLKQNRERNKNIVHQLVLQEDNRFTGKLIVKTTSDVEWILHFCLGRLVWASGGNHMIRRLYRHIRKTCPQITLTMLALREKQGFKYGWDYQVIDTLVLRKKITREQASLLISKIVDEVLFDILQYESRDWLTYHHESIKIQDSEMGFLILLNIKMTLKKLCVYWKIWKTENVGNVLLESAPTLYNFQDLQSKISPSAYQKLIKFINGKRTLREIAVLIKQDEIKVVKWLSPLIRRGYVRLRELPDFPRPENPNQCSRLLASPHSRNQPLIACVDDSPQICYEMEKILEKAGYLVIGIQDPIHALGVLIDRKPDLIFLDLMMPIVNGYELCTQIRRVSALKHIPIVILTGGMIDRLRAAIVGASDCLEKPINSQKVLTTVSKQITKSSSQTPSFRSQPPPPIKIKFSSS